MTTNTRLMALAMITLLLAACNDSTDVSAEARLAHETLFAASPDPDPFYAAPASIPDVPGTILKSRSITYQPAGIPLPNQAWQLQYATRDVNGKAIAAVTTVIKPTVPSPYGHPVLLSFQHAYDSLGPLCTPSHTATGSTRSETSMEETLEFLPGMQALGWTLVIPDYEGPDHHFGAGRISGQATLDSIQAALHFEPLGLSQDTPVGLMGYSGGAYATTWAAALQSRYAPNLNLVGAVSGGTPVNMFALMSKVENNSFFSLGMSVVFGAARAYPALLPSSLLNKKGLQALASLRDSCGGKTSDGSAPPSGKFSDYINSAAFDQSPGLLSEGPKMNVMQTGLIPAVDMYFYHEINDELVPISAADSLVEQWCAAGVPLNYFRSSVADPVVVAASPTGGHGTGTVAGAPAAIIYLTGRFSGSPVPLTPPGTVRCN